MRNALLYICTHACQFWYPIPRETARHDPTHIPNRNASKIKAPRLNPSPSSFEIRHSSFAVAFSIHTSSFMLPSSPVSITGALIPREQFIPTKPRLPREKHHSDNFQITENLKFTEIYRGNNSPHRRNALKTGLFPLRPKTTSKEKSGRIRCPLGNNSAQKTSFPSRKPQYGRLRNLKKPQIRRENVLEQFRQYTKTPRNGTP